MLKNKEYYEALDKRTNEFKEWKKTQDIQANDIADMQEFADGFIEGIAQEDLKAKHEASPTIITTLGAGDLVEKIAKVTGVKAIVERFTPEGKDCGCDKRKEVLNTIAVLKNKKKVECLTVEEYNYMSGLNLFANGKVSGEDVSRLQVIYQRVFNLKTISGCTGCSFAKKLDELKAVLNTYK